MGTEALAVFSNHGPARSPSQSVAEYIMDCLVLEREPSEALRVDELTALEQKKAAAMPALDDAPPESKVSYLFNTVTKPGVRRYEAPFLRQVVLLFRRHAKLAIHEIFTPTTTMMNVGMMFIAGLLWWRLGFTDAEVYPRFGACCWVMGTWMFFPVMGGTHAFMGDRPVLEKELKVGCYSLHSYYIARTLLTLPIEWIWPLLWTTSVFWMTNLNPSFWIYMAVLCLVLVDYTMFQAVGLVIAASNIPMHQAATVSILLITYFFGWSGLLMDMGRIPAWIRWGGEVNIFKSVVNLMFGLVTDGVEHVCGESYAGGDVAKADIGCDDGVISPTEARLRMGVLRSPLADVILVASALVACRFLAYVLLRKSMRSAIDGASAGASKPAMSAPLPVSLSEDPEKQEKPSEGGSDAV